MSDEAQDTKTLGQLIDTLGVANAVREGELVADAVVILKVLDEDNDIQLRLAWSEGISWIERLGMLNVALMLDAPGGVIDDLD